MIEKTWENTHEHYASFVSAPDNFISSKVGLKWLQKTYPFANRNFICTTELIYESLDLSQFVNSKILVIGGGPSTRDCQWSAEDYDHVFTCNHFFLNERVSQIKCDLVTISDEVNLKDKQFLEYVEKHKPVLFFENCTRFKVTKSYNDLVELHNIYDKCIMAYLRYLSKIGATPRLLVLATLLGASQVHVVGMDGYPRNTPHGSDSNHAFQPNKKMLGTYDWNNFHEQFKVLWEYLRYNIGKDVVYKNLGEGHPYNMSTGII